jgi:hypothetical protein
MGVNKLQFRSKIEKGDSAKREELFTVKTN